MTLCGGNDSLSSSLIDTPESLGLNFRRTVVPFDVSNASASGLTLSNLGGSDGENDDAGGVRAEDAVDERDELDAKSGNGNAPKAGL